MKEKKKVNIKLIMKNKVIFVYLGSKLFFYQPFLKTTDKKIKSATFTYYFVLLQLYKFGLR